MADSIRGRFLWHELMTTDPNSAQGFYSKVVGWKTQGWDQDPSYKMWMAGGRRMGGLMKHPEEANKLAPPPSWFSYIGTLDVDATVDQAVALGGKVIKRAWDIPNIGRMAILQDPQGAMFYVFTPETGPAGSSDGETALGDFSWHELLTTDWQSAWNFYQKLFGWEKTSAMDMGGGNTYQMFGFRGRPMGGMFNKSKDMPGPAQWLPYALVPDSKKAAETIKQNGGTVLNGPMEVAGGDWIVTGFDRQGALFAVHSKNPNAAATPRPAAASSASARPRGRKAVARSKAARPARKSRPLRKARSVKKAKPSRRSKPLQKRRKGTRSKRR